MCSCFEDMDRALKAQNTRLVPNFVQRIDKALSAVDVITVISIATERINTGNTSGPVKLLPNYCPFCGEQIEYTYSPQESSGSEAGSPETA